jgi:hypothetical protein
VANPRDPGPQTSKTLRSGLCRGASGPPVIHMDPHGQHSSKHHHENRLLFIISVSGRDKHLYDDSVALSTVMLINSFPPFRIPPNSWAREDTVLVPVEHMHVHICPHAPHSAPHGQVRSHSLSHNPNVLFLSFTMDNPHHSVGPHAITSRRKTLNNCTAVLGSISTRASRGNFC